jgi:CheY-like chemotaxis protein
MSFDLLTTTRIDEALRWVEQGRIDTLVSDWVIPGADGLDLLAEAHQIDDRIELKLLTSHSISETVEHRVQELGANHYEKTTGLGQLLTDLSAPPAEKASGLSDRSESTRDKRLEGLYVAVVQPLLDELYAVPNPHSARISSSSESFSVAELIDDVRELTPRGLEHIGLWLRMLHTLQRLGADS